MNSQRYLRLGGLSILAGIFAGAAASIFLISLEWMTATREQAPQMIWFLPLAGLFIGWCYHRFGQNIAAGNHLIIDEIHEPKKTVPFRMAPFILLGTLVTHLFGGSAGREGTVVQMGASLSDQLSRIFNITPVERKALLVAGAGAGFGAAIGAPWAGVIFGMEFIRIGRFKLFAVFECAVASLTAYWVSRLLGAPHTAYPSVEVPSYMLTTFFFVAMAGVAFGLAAWIFVKFAHAVEYVFDRYIKYPPLRPFVGGVILVALFYLEGTYRFVGLGIPYIQDALLAQSGFDEPALKAFFTALTVGTGFKGGEFIPLVFVGTTLGSALAVWLPVSFSLLAAVGFAAVFGAAANTPIACTIMAMEIFGWHIGPYAFVACMVGYFISGRRGIYKNQRT